MWENNSVISTMDVNSSGEIITIYLNIVIFPNTYKNVSKDSFILLS